MEYEEIIQGLVVGQGGALFVLLLWIRAITKDRDWWRDRWMELYGLGKVAIDELEQRPAPRGNNV